VADLDGDGHMEVVFGNFDGYVHILEFVEDQENSTYSPALHDPYRLKDEWRSPYLGYGLSGHDMFYVNGKAQMFFSNALGQIWRINATNPDTYVVANGVQPIATQDGHNLYWGDTPILLVNDFDSSNTGNEIVALNRFLDFSMFKLDGTLFPLQDRRRERGPHIVGPTDAFPVNMGRQGKDLLVAAYDGNLWDLHWNNSLSPKTWDEPAPPVATGLALYKVVPFPALINGNQHVLALLFGQNADCDDNNANLTVPVSPNAVQLWDLMAVPPAKLAEADTSIDDDVVSSFAWLTKPTNSNPTGTFVVSGGGQLQKFSFTLSVSGSAIAEVAAATVIPPPTNGENPIPDNITSVDAPMLKDDNGSTKQCVVFAVSDGRIYVTDPNSTPPFAYLRYSNQESPTATPTGGAAVTGAFDTLRSILTSPNDVPNPVPWASNRTLARTYTCDMLQPSTGVGDLYFADYEAPYWLDSVAPTAGPYKHCRLGKIEFKTTGGNTWNSIVTFGSPPAQLQEALNDSHSHFENSDFVRYLHRKLIYRDLDSDGVPEARIFFETGTAWNDGAGVREFQTASALPICILSGTTGASIQGGRIFELPANRNHGVYGFTNSGGAYTYNKYSYLGGFYSPWEAPYANFSAGANGWWYPTVGPHFLTGQIADSSQSTSGQSLGTSTTHALLGPTPGATPVEHVVVGTDNGFVFAILPGPANTSGGLVSSSISYASHNLGSYVVGLDTGTLLDSGGTPTTEIVCGTWIDNGNYVDWLNGTASKNRGHLHILKPNSSSGFDVTTLDGDDLCGTGQGIGSGVAGVKLDDVKGNGHFEIWCTDALGHVYLFSQWDSLNNVQVPWHCVFRSDDHVPFAGFYNNIYPVKGGQGQTKMLVLVSPGYVVAYGVDPTLV
jgi:hypothetical protein